MTAANIYQDTLHYCKTAWQLVTHPFITIRALASTEPDRDDMFLYVLNCIIQLIPNLLAVLTTLFTARSLDMSGLSLLMLFLYTIGLPIFLFIGYWLWRLCAFIIWKLLSIMGGNGTSINVRTGLLHFTLLSTLLGLIIPILLCASSFAIFIITLLSSAAFTASMLSGIVSVLSILAMAFIPIYLWFLYLTIRFLKESSHLSYSRTILALLLPSIPVILIMLIMSAN
ncbi:hypothetical protein [Veillonella magna]|uniref:hypothetical protein n=1 Tax=Veillonella magna TaxID=464322 RepID=UPI0026664299|nr:hypothetical protein [Veillonella magna]